MKNLYHVRYNYYRDCNRILCRMWCIPQTARGTRGMPSASTRRAIIIIAPPGGNHKRINKAVAVQRRDEQEG